MLRDIAVFLGEKGETVEMGETGKIVVYHRERGVWHITQEQRLFPEGRCNLTEVRRQMREILGFLGECKVFVASAVTGVYYYELEKAEVSVWEFSGSPQTFLDYIATNEENQHMAEIPPQNIVPIPSEIADGRYYVSIKEIQENNSSITSKQVLQPFLRRGKFYSLEILCNHIPPWLENELVSSNLTSEVTRINNKEIKVVIMAACCT
jgi:Fe-only nitrogenase accessory protein AnfO